MGMDKGDGKGGCIPQVERVLGTGVACGEGEAPVLL